MISRSLLGSLGIHSTPTAPTHVDPNSYIKENENTSSEIRCIKTELGANESLVNFMKQSSLREQYETFY